MRKTRSMIMFIYPAVDGLKFYQGLKEYFNYYKYKQHHQGIERSIPADLYIPVV